METEARERRREVVEEPPQVLPLCFVLRRTVRHRRSFPCLECEPVEYLMNETPAQGNVPTGPTARPVGSSLRARMRLYALAGFIVVGGWLYFTIQSVYGLYDSTVQIARFTELRERVSDATAGLQEADASLDRYTRDGEGFDLSQHYSARTTIKTSLGAISNHPLTEGMLGAYRRADAAETVYEQAADRAIASRGDKAPGESLAVRDNRASPASARLA